MRLSRCQYESEKTSDRRRAYPSQPALLQPGILPSCTDPHISAMAQNSFAPLMENIMNTLWPARSRQTALIRSLQPGRLVTAPLARQYLMSESRSTFMQMNLACAMVSGCATTVEWRLHTSSGISNVSGFAWESTCAAPLKVSWHMSPVTFKSLLMESGCSACLQISISSGIG
jgi:hypothetical protein